MLGESPCGRGADGAKATSSSTGILQGRSNHPRGGIFTCLFKGQKLVFKDELDKDKDTTYIHWTLKNEMKNQKIVGSDTNKIVTS